MRGSHSPWARVLLVSFLVGCTAAPPRAREPLTVPGTSPAAKFAELAGGGGGVDGTFAVDGNGAATYSIDIEVPPGTNGVQPELSLEYNSQRNNGLLGMGWALSGIDAIERCGASPIPDGFTGAVAYHANDRFCLGGIPLVAVNGVYGADGTEYRTMLDTWTRIVSKETCGSGPCWFEAQNRDGATLRFGFTTGATGSRIMAVGANGVRVWSIDRYQDLNGNYTEVTYETGSSGDYYPVAIRYTGNAHTQRAPTREVSFSYHARTDSILSFAGGARFGVFKRLDAITTRAGDDVALVYRLGYDTSATTGRARVTSIRKCDAEGNCLDPAEFAYTDPGSKFIDGDVQPGAVPGDSSDFMAMDVNGDGFTDLVFRDSRSNDYIVLWRAGGGKFISTSFVPGVTIGNGGLHASDVNGDGRIDLVTPANGSDKVDIATYLSNGTRFDPAISSSFPMFSDEQQFMSMDVNADGLEDVVRVGGPRLDEVDVLIAQADGRFQGPYSMSIEGHGVGAQLLPLDANGDGRVDLALPFRLDFDPSSLIVQIYLSEGTSYSTTQFSAGGLSSCLAEQYLAGDVNGDGLSDVILACEQQTAIQVTPLLSSATTFFPQATVTLPKGDANRGLLVMDVNSDGRADLVQAVETGQSRTLAFIPWLSNGSTFVAQPPNLTTRPADVKTFLPMDLSGSGRTDIVALRDDGGTLQASIFPNRSGQPDLLTTVKSARGGEVQVTHAPLTDSSVYTRGSGATWPIVDVLSPMPVVKSYANLDGRGARYQFDYRYEQARLGHEGRGWLGFRRVIMTEPAGGRRTEMTYEQEWPRNGTPLLTDVYDGQGRLLTRMEGMYADIASQELQAKNVHQIVRTAEWLSMYDNVTETRLYKLVKDYRHDAYGNVTLVSELGANGTTSDDRFVCARYDNDPVRWQFGYLKQDKTTRSLAACEAFLAAADPAWDPATDLRWTRRDYDERKNLVLNASWDDSHATWVGMSAAYDDYGNRVAIVDPAQNATTLTYDDETKTFPVQIVSPVTGSGARLTDTYRFDPRFGEQLEHIDQNGNVFRQELDGFGEVVAELGPDPSGNTVVLRRSSHGSDANGFYQRESTRPEWDSGDDAAAWAWEKTYVDGLDRAYRTESKGATDQTAIVEEMTFDAEGRIDRTAVPRFLDQATSWIVTEYDAYNRPTKTTQPDGVIETVTYPRGALKFARTTAFGTPDANTEVIEANAYGQITSRTQANGEVFRYTYSLMGELLAIDTTLEPRRQSFGYDSLGRVRSMESPNAGRTQYHFDAVGRMTGSTDASGNTITYAYDNLGRITSAASNVAGDGTTLFTYDGPTANGKGQLTYVAMSRPQVGAYSFTLAYDAYEQTTGVQIALGGTTYAYGNRFAPTGQLTAQTYPDGTELSVGYGADLLPRTMSLAASQGATPETYVTHADYGPFEVPLETTYKNGVEVSRRFYSNDNGLGKLAELKAVSTKASRTLYERTFLWNDLALVTAQNAPDAAQSASYGYDNKTGAMTTAKGPFGTQTFAYDKSGNRTKADAIESTYEPGTDRLKTFGPDTLLTWNANGTLKTMKNGSDALTFAYDAEGQLVSASREGVAQAAAFAYDFLGRRIFHQPIGSSTKTYSVTDDYDVVDDGSGTLRITKYIDDLFGKSVAITTVATPEVRAAMRVNAHRIGAEMHRGTLRGVAESALAAVHDPELPEQIGGGLLFGAPALLLFLRRRRRTDFAKRAPLYERIAPLVIAAMLLMSAMPAHAATPATTAASDTLYFVQDIDGSTVSVTRDDGSEAASASYLPYGALDAANSKGDTDFRPKFTGKTFDQDTGLYYFGDRYYHPATGRYTTPDPQNQFLNPYVFAADSPASMVDPDGDFGFLIALLVGAIVGAYFGGAAVNGSYNPANWDWKSWKTYAGIFGGAAIGAVGGALTFVAATSGAVAGLVTAAVVGAAENVAFTAMGGGSGKELLVAAGTGAFFGFLGAGAARGLSVLASRFGNRAGSAAARAGSGVADDAADAARGVGNACSSFVAGEQVLLGTGGRKPIEQLAEGDRVAAYQAARKRAGEFRVQATVSGTTTSLTRITTESGAVITSTPGHLIGAHGMGWIRADQLWAGASLTTATGGASRVRSVETTSTATPLPVYNITVDEAASYHVSADEVLVSNTPTQCLLKKGKTRPAFRKSVKDAVFKSQAQGRGMIKSAVSSKRFARTRKVWIGKRNPRQISIWQLDHKTPYRFLLWAAYKTKKPISWKDMSEISNYQKNLRYITMAENVGHSFEPATAVGQRQAKAILKALGYWKE